MIKKLLCCLSVFLGGILQSQAAVTLVWVSEVGLESFQSTGTDRVDSTFTADLGIFRNGFLPVESNQHEWLTNWQPLGTSAYNEVDDYFSGTAVLTSNTAAPEGARVYIWLKGEADPVDGSQEWYVATRVNANPDLDWVIPDVSQTDQTDRPKYFEISNINYTGLTVPFGNTPTSTGIGMETGTPTGGWSVQTQTYFPVPEPSTAVLGVLALCGGLVRRRRSH